MKAEARAERAETGGGPNAVESEAFYEALQDLVRTCQFRDRQRACWGDLSINECYALEVLDRRGTCSVLGLAAELCLDKSGASRVARGLVAKGYAERRPRAGDGRGVDLVPTAAGTAAHADVRRRIQAEQAPLLAALDPVSRRAACELLRELARVARARPAGCGTPSC